MDIATRMNFTNKHEIEKEISGGGDWLGSARKWMQSNVKNGDTLAWNSTETIHLPFYKLEELAKTVAVAAIAEDRRKTKIPSDGGEFCDVFG